MTKIMTRKEKPARADGLGAAVKNLRIQKGWTLANLSERTGMQVSSLSKVENDKIALTYDKLMRLADGLQVEISQLLLPEAERRKRPQVVGGRRSVDPAGSGRIINTENYVYRYLATNMLNKGFVPILGEVKARTLEEFGELIQHPGEEFIYVLEGVIILHTDLYAPLHLEVGDSVYFDSQTGHAYLAAGDGPCRMLSICTATEAILIDHATRDAEAMQRSENGRLTTDGD